MTQTRITNRTPPQSHYHPLTYSALSNNIMRRKLIIDTDTGVDDAMALLMALEAHKRGEVEVLAITAVSGNTEESHAHRNILRTIGICAGCRFSSF